MSRVKVFPKRWSIKSWPPEILSPREKDSRSSSVMDAEHQVPLEAHKALRLQEDSHSVRKAPCLGQFQDFPNIPHPNPCMDYNNSPWNPLRELLEKPSYLS